MTRQTRLPAPWRFYLGLDQPEPSTDWYAEALVTPARPEHLWRRFPLIDNGDGKPVPLPRVLFDALDKLEAEGAPARIIAAHRFHFLKAAASRGAGFQSDETFTAFEAMLDLSDAGREELSHEWERLKPFLPLSGHLLQPDHTLPLWLYRESLNARFSERRTAWCAELKHLADRLLDILRVEDGKQPRDAETLNAVLGKPGELFDTEAMATILSVPKGTPTMSAERRRRIADTLSVLAEFLQNPVKDLILCHRESLPCLADHPMQTASDGFQRAAEIFSGRVERLNRVFRAVRAARLELHGDYLPERHDLLLARFDWRDCTEDERFQLPQILVVERAEYLKGEHLGRFAALTASGLPLRVLLLRDAIELPDPNLGHIDIASVARACRGTFVTQTSTARPMHMLHGWNHMLEAIGPAVMVAAVPPDNCDTPLLLLEAALMSRATPLFHDDPNAGAHQAERFSLDGNPDPEAALAGDPPVTPADALSLLPRARHHFLPVTEEEPATAPLPQVLSSDNEDALPVIQALNEDETSRRVYIDGTVAGWCAALAADWRILQEQAGIDNPHAQRAAREAREEAQAELSQKEQEWKQRLEDIRDEAGREAMTRLARGLLDLEPDSLLPAARPLPSPTSPEAAEEPAEEVEPKPSPQAEPEEENYSEEPYINSAMCTSCDECTNLNSLMFKYNGDGQAYIADATRGTFEQLVSAAESCPAHIIHPGEPRPDDATATPEVLQRAAALP
ncbi:MAG: ferredoxin [Acidobacteriota bacterium]|nr:ferredoxin [Acidobacteriota bacterium]